MKKTPKEKKLSENVKRFLQKKEEEEQKKKMEERQKKENLLQMRNENKKSVRTVKSMLQRTKSANKSALLEAKNLRDTADTMSGRMQCDEDDYGYESQACQGLYEKLMAKYEKHPEDPMAKFSQSGPKKVKDIQSTLARVKNRLENGVDESEVRVSKKVKSSSSNSSESHSSHSHTEDKRSKREREEDEARKKRLSLAKKAPPPPSFEELMKMAQQKHKEPVKFDKKPIREAEFNRPMTKKEKEEYIRERESQLRKAGKLPPKQHIKSSSAGEPQKASKPSSSESKAQPSSSKPSSSKQQTSVPKSGISAPAPEKKKPVIAGPEFHPAVVGKSKSKSNSEKKKYDDRPVQRKRSRSRSRSRSASPIPHKISKSRNRIESEDEDEYDSEMDDFIDDSDAKMDISAQIRSIFGYDKRKYHDEDFDDRSMENNRFSDLMKEEARSAKIGMMEDLEDMRREEEEKKRKMMKKKQRR